MDPTKIAQFRQTMISQGADPNQVDQFIAQKTGQSNQAPSDSNPVGDFVGGMANTAVGVGRAALGAVKEGLDVLPHPGESEADWNARVGQSRQNDPFLTNEQKAGYSKPGAEGLIQGAKDIAGTESFLVPGGGSVPALAGKGALMGAGYSFAQPNSTPESVATGTITGAIANPVMSKVIGKLTGAGEVAAEGQPSKASQVFLKQFDLEKSGLSQADANEAAQTVLDNGFWRNQGKLSTLRDKVMQITGTLRDRVLGDTNTQVSMDKPLEVLRTAFDEKANPNVDPALLARHQGFAERLLNLLTEPSGPVENLAPGRRIPGGIANTATGSMGEIVAPGSTNVLTGGTAPAGAQDIVEAIGKKFAEAKTLAAKGDAAQGNLADAYLKVYNAVKDSIDEAITKSGSLTPELKAEFAQQLQEAGLNAEAEKVTSANTGRELTSVLHTWMNVGRLLDAAKPAEGMGLKDLVAFGGAFPSGGSSLLLEAPRVARAVLGPGGATSMAAQAMTKFPKVATAASETPIAGNITKTIAPSVVGSKFLNPPSLALAGKEKSQTDPMQESQAALKRLNDWRAEVAPIAAASPYFASIVTAKYETELQNIKFNQLSSVSDDIKQRIGSSPTGLLNFPLVDAVRRLGDVNYSKLMSDVAFVNKAASDLGYPSLIDPQSPVNDVLAKLDQLKSNMAGGLNTGSPATSNSVAPAFTGGQ